jgi:serine/threonine protein kinase
MHNIQDFYEFQQVLGVGHFGTVREAIRKDSDIQKKYAVKSILKSKIDMKNIDKLRRELDLLIELDHPNIIKLHQVFEDERYMHLVTDVCYGGDLFDRITNADSLSEREACNVMRKLL